MTAPRRLAVLLSGSGRTLENLLDAIAAGRLAATVVLVVSSRPDVRGVHRPVPHRLLLHGRRDDVVHPVPPREVDDWPVQLLRRLRPLHAVRCWLLRGTWRHGVRAVPYQRTLCWWPYHCDSWLVV